MIYRAIFRGTDKTYAITQGNITVGVQLYEIARDIFGCPNINHFVCTRQPFDYDVCLYLGENAARYARDHCSHLVDGNKIFNGSCQVFVDVGTGFFNFADDIDALTFDTASFTGDPLTFPGIGSGILKLSVCRDESADLWFPCWQIDVEKLFNWWDHNGFFWEESLDTTLVYPTIKAWYELKINSDDTDKLPYSLFPGDTCFNGELIHQSEIMQWVGVDPSVWVATGPFGDSTSMVLPCKHYDVSGL